MKTWEFRNLTGEIIDGVNTIRFEDLQQIRHRESISYITIKDKFPDISETLTFEQILRSEVAKTAHGISEFDDRSYMYAPQIMFVEDIDAAYYRRPHYDSALIVMDAVCCGLYLGGRSPMSSSKKFAKVYLHALGVSGSRWQYVVLHVQPSSVRPLTAPYTAKLIKRFYDDPRAA